MRRRVAVRRFRGADFDRILAIETAGFGEDAYDRKLFAEFFHTSGDLFLVAEYGGNVCGYIITCICERNTPHRAELVSIAVAPASRGQGVASALLTSTLRRLRLRRIARIGLMVKVSNRAARAFYEKYGFRKVRMVRGYYEDGADGVLMSRSV